MKCLLLFIALASGQVHAAEHVTYYVNDALGSPILAMDEQGAVVWQESYQPYGQRQVKPAVANYDEQFYTGKQEEPDIGLQYFGARWYDPEAGRFTSIDPVGVQEGELHSFNRYAYANNNPYRFTDPNGESPIDVAFFAVDALAFGVAVASGNSQEIRSSGIDLAMSAIGLISPVPGTGQALKMVKAGKALNHVGDAAKAGERLATGFKGSKGFELKNAKYQKTRNADGVVNGREYTGHAFDQMQNRGVMPSSVENAIKYGKASPDPIPGRTRHFDAENNITVVSEAERVVTVMSGKR